MRKKRSSALICGPKSQRTKGPAMTGVERRLFTVEDTERPAGELGTVTASQPEDTLAQPEVAPSHH